MKKLSDYKGQKIAIRCKTDDEIRAILKLNNTNLDIESVIRGKNRQSEGFEFAYRISDGWCSVKNYQKQGYTILHATDFLEEEFVYGQEYEFSDYEDFRAFLKQKYISKNPDNSGFISWDDENYCPEYWKYCRKINTERNEAITTIKELVSKFSINQNEVF